MPFDVGDTVLSWMEAVRAWVLQQPWLDFAHDWIYKVEGSTLWAIIVVATAGLVLLIGFWPTGKPNTPHKTPEKTPP